MPTLQRIVVVLGVVIGSRHSVAAAPGHTDRESSDAPARGGAWRLVLHDGDRPADAPLPEPVATATRGDADPLHLLASETNAVRLTTKINGTLTTADHRFGGCMVALDRPLRDAALDCPGSWITLSCSGVHGSAEAARRKFQFARDAFRTGRTVVVEVTDEKKHHGWCYGQRLDVLAR